MPITKTSPSPIMTVGNYKDAALQHFNTCKILWQYVNLPDSSNLKNINQDVILKNIFYLSGYVVECALKYQHCINAGLNETDNQQYWISKGIKINTHFSFTKNTDTAWSEKVLQGIIASSSIKIPNYLKKLANASAYINLNSDEEIIYEMQKSWEPTIRYHFETNGLVVNKSDIEAFYHATDQLLNNLFLI